MSALIEEAINELGAGAAHLVQVTTDQYEKAFDLLMKLGKIFVCQADGFSKR
ncbi:hypothetical protein ACFVAJ_17550 [Agromyces sp. NPDC057679]|uniref:hypothetical protein n=1 Tax=Agromyces sp. NPDC057679 TaxID=3346207 RepID=UPI00366F9EC2